MSGDDLTEAMAFNLLQMQRQMASMMQNDQSGDALASATAPLEITAQLQRQIKALPSAQRVHSVWYIHTDVDNAQGLSPGGGVTFTATVFQVTKEKGSNGLILPDSDGLGMTLAMCSVSDPLGDATRRAPLLLGTLAKACLHPGSNAFGPSLLPPEAMEAVDMRPSRPRKVLFQTRGEMELCEEDLCKMGIQSVGVADRMLAQSVERYSSVASTINVTPVSGDPVEVAMRLRSLGEAVEDPYVSEERVPLGSWEPPTGGPPLPWRWYARPPDPDGPWRPSELLGWRTNLETAIMREDEAKVNEIVLQRNKKDVREFVECRMFLDKVVQRDMPTACRLLIEKCGASVEGIQAPDAKSSWREMQKASGSEGDLTPLHHAARNGKTEAARILLEHGANVNAVDRDVCRGSPLLHAVSQGQLDCVRLFCKNGADHSHVAMGGEALDVSTMMGMQSDAHHRVQEKVQRILREFDPRCSHCRSPDPAKTCPCRKERYCGVGCQRERWNKHKRHHKEIVG